MSRRRRCPCPTPSKGAYLTEEEAAEDAQRIAKRVDAVGSRKAQAFYLYWCACRRYHLTHHAIDPDGHFQKRVA